MEPLAGSGTAAGDGSTLSTGRANRAARSGSARIRASPRISEPTASKITKG